MGAFMAPIINLSMVQNQFQYIIIGAGCAGLQLAKALLEQSSDLVSSILLIDINLLINFISYIVVLP
jgi:NADH dehydrogenase FAD-containing subunit